MLLKTVVPVFVVVHVCRTVDRVVGHPRPSSVEALVYRWCPCRDPPRDRHVEAGRCCFVAGQLCEAHERRGSDSEVKVGQVSEGMNGPCVTILNNVPTAESFLETREASSQPTSRASETNPRPKGPGRSGVDPTHEGGIHRWLSLGTQETPVMAASTSAFACA